MPRFVIGDKTDKALCAVITHECLLCKEALEQFHELLLGCENGGSDIKYILRLHGTYQRFVQHLYEVLVACFQREEGNTSQLKPEKVEREINNILGRLWSSKRRPQSKNLDQCATIEEFMSRTADYAGKFRAARNISAHALTKRAISGYSLYEFCKEYHWLNVLLYRDVADWWARRPEEQVNWEDIGRFDMRKLIFEIGSQIKN